MDYKRELVLIPVSDVDRAKKFYLEQVGFVLIVDTPIGPDQRVVQVVPPGPAWAMGVGPRAPCRRAGGGPGPAPGGFRHPRRAGRTDRARGSRQRSAPSPGRNVGR